ncbi:KdsC family phosphatase [Pararhodonellum marinum]|uniref:KdsC family phosphatase n=1 Tax=Pararhodonellum marinum TaxID=2755358 RepID=UPI00188DD7BE|nr:HAD hydrolase family protein [Pararhodonellum marinum]
MLDHLEGIASHIFEKAKAIKLIITDIDGVMTDGGIIYDDNQLEYKKFNVKDGLIVHHLQHHHIKVGAITGRDSLVVRNRCEELKFDFHLHGVKNKMEKLHEVLGMLGISLSACAYLGDDLIDLPILTKVGLSVAPADALPYVQAKVDHVSTKKGGEGVFRELADIILHAQGHLIPLIEKHAK